MSFRFLILPYQQAVPIPRIPLNREIAASLVHIAMLNRYLNALSARWCSSLSSVMLKGVGLLVLEKRNSRNLNIGKAPSWCFPYLSLSSKGYFFAGDTCVIPYHLDVIPHFLIHKLAERGPS